MRCLIVVIALGLAACRQPGLSETSRTLHLSPGVADFGALYPGQSQQLRLRLRNDGPPAQLKWIGPEAPFGLFEDLPTEAPSGELELTVRFAPEAVGTFTATLQVEAEALGSTRALLVGHARGIPDCPPSGACHQVEFDLDTGACVERPLADGVSCAASNVCLLSPTCFRGRCVGLEKSCDDANACTTDTCNAVIGCEHLPAPPCPGDGKCQVGVCHPATGCQLERALDGTPCGPQQSCNAAEVCIEGSCVIRDPPEGYVCAEASPCQGEGRCVADVCERPAATALAPTWSFDALTVDAGVGRGPPLLHQLLLEPSGAMTLAGAFASTPQLRRNTPATVEPAMGMASRCLLWNGRLICSRPNDALHAVDLATGANLWTFNLRVARPDFKVRTLFVARVAVQSSDRLATLWEAYPDQTECRTYFLAILDASGRLVSAQQLSDPAFSLCNHPHAYGFAADAAGQLFVAFAPTVKNPPLVSGTPTLVMSFSRDGVFRWKYSDVMLKGGELAVGRGLLYSENSATAVLTSTGQPAFTLAQTFGRPTVTRDRLILAPRLGADRLEGYEAGSSLLRWTHGLPAGHTFGSDQVRLAAWSTRRGAQTVALTFTSHGAQTWLRAISPRDGAEAFSCQLVQPGRTAPQQLEVAHGAIGVMNGAGGCATCEPAHADKSGAFHSIPVPSLAPATREPWVGTWGGPGHGHQEQP